MADHEALAQSLHERIEVQPAVERAECGGGIVRTRPAFADGMALRTHYLGQRAALLLRSTGQVVLGDAGRCSEEQKDEHKSCDHFRAAQLNFNATSKLGWSWSSEFPGSRRRERIRADANARSR